MESVEYGVKELVAEAADIPFASVEDGYILSVDLDLDSLELVNLAQNIESALGVELTDADVRADMTVAELVRVVCGKVPTTKGE